MQWQAENAPARVAPDMGVAGSTLSFRDSSAGRRAALPGATQCYRAEREAPLVLSRSGSRKRLSGALPLPAASLTAESGTFSSGV